MADPRFITASEVEGGVIPTGGTTDQVLAKQSNADFDLKWATGGGGGSANISVIDLGVINVADFLAGPQTLIPYTPGYFVKSIKFLPDTWENPTGSVFDVFSFGTPVTWPYDTSGFAGADLSSNIWYDTDKTVSKASFGGWSGGIDINTLYTGGGLALYSMILDQTPLMASLLGGSLTSSGRWIPLTWTANTKVAVYDYLIGNGHVQQYTTGGVTGSTEPDWDTSGGTTDDGTAQTTDVGDATVTGKIHAVAEMVNFPDVIIPTPTSLEITQQPTSVVAGEVIAPAITVQLLDQFSQPISNPPYSTYMHVAILGAGTLGGSNEKVIDSNGVVTFDDLTITEPADGYILQFRVLELGTFVPRVDSSPFDVIPSFAINAIDQLTKTITVTGDASALSGSIVVSGSTGNDGIYTVVTAIFTTDHTDIVVVQSLPDATADGSVHQ